MTDWEEGPSYITIFGAGATGRAWVEMDERPAPECPLIGWWSERLDSDRVLDYTEGSDGGAVAPPRINSRVDPKLSCATCHDWIFRAHLHIYREFPEYRDDPHMPSWIACSEGCAIALVTALEVDLIPKPEGVRT